MLKRRKPGATADGWNAAQGPHLDYEKLRAAVLELDRQQTQVRLSRRTLLVDVVLDAPGRFREAVTEATEDALSSARPATVRARFRGSEGASPEEVAASVDRVGAGGGLADDGEDIEVLELPLREALAMVGSGEIADGKTVLLLQWACLEGLAA